MGIGVSFLVVQLQKDSGRIPTESNRSEHLSWLEPQPPQSVVRSLPPGKFTTPLALPETVMSCQEIQILAQSTPDLKKQGKCVCHQFFIKWKLQFFSFFHSFTLLKPIVQGGTHLVEGKYPIVEGIHKQPRNLWKQSACEASTPQSLRHKL